MNYILNKNHNNYFQNNDILPPKLQFLFSKTDTISIINQKEYKNCPERIFIVHGENEGAKALKNDIERTYSWKAEIPQLYSIEEIV